MEVCLLRKFFRKSRYIASELQNSVGPRVIEVFLKSIGHSPVYLKGGNGNKRRGRSSACCELSFVQHTHVCPFQPNLLKVQYLNVFSATPEVLAVAAATAVGGGGWR